MESITNRWRNLSLNDREGGKLRVKKDQATKEYSVAAKFLTPRVLNTEAIVRTFSPLWRSRNGFQVRELGDHTRLFVFDNAEEIEKILASEPWSFDRHLVVLQRVTNASPVHELIFKTVSLWVQVHDIPVSFWKREIAEELCDAVGLVNRESRAEEVDGGSFFRVRVQVDISVPLCRGRVLSIEDEEEHWVSFKYERLPNLCYWCGCLDHTDRDCEKWIESDGSLRNSDKEYGPWIRASPNQGRRKPVVVVPGFYEARKKGGSGKASKAAMQATPPSKEVRADGTHASKETEDVTDGIDEHSGESLNGCENAKVKPPAVFNADLNGNNRDIIEERIREIDEELNKFDFSGRNSREAAANQLNVGVDYAINEKIPNRTKETELGLEAGAAHVVHLSSLPLENLEIVQPDTLISKESKACMVGSASRTWTRKARVGQRVPDGCPKEGINSSKRPMMEVDEDEKIKKRRVNVQTSKENLSMVEAAAQPRQEQ